MSERRFHCRFTAVVLACQLVAGCSLLRHQAGSAAPAAPSPVLPAASPAAASQAAAAAPQPAPGRVPRADWDPAVVHLDPEAMVGQTWVFPSSSPVRYGNDRFVFKRDRVEASNARDHATGAWTVERDRLCITLNPGAWGSACYVVTGSPANGWQIRVLPDGDRVPLKIEQEVR